MPTYEYECQSCGLVFEKFQSMTAKPVRRCPECRHGVKRLIGTGAGVLFKGSGFYETDYRSDSYKNAAKREQEKAKPETPSESGDSKADGGKTKKTEKAAATAKAADS